MVLVDDDRAYPMMLERALALEPVGLRLLTLRDGPEARAYLSDCFLSNCLPAVVLLDLHLPGETGLELLAWIRSQEGGTELTVLVHSWSECSHAARAAGASGFIEKPKGLPGLRALVRSLAAHCR